MLDKLSYLVDNYDELYGSLTDEEFFRPFSELGIELIDVPVVETESIMLCDDISYYEEVYSFSDIELLCA